MGPVLAELDELAIVVVIDNGKQGEDVIIAGSVSNDEAKQIFGSWKEPRPYIRIVPQPS